MPGPSTRLSHDQYVAHLQRESARLQEVLAEAADDARVPTCPDWTTLDLLWHMAEGHLFWTAAVELNGASPADVGDQAARPTSDRTELARLAQQAADSFAQALATRGPDAACWTWADEHTTGWVARRQAHEALIHRVDAELTAGDRSPRQPAFAADGVDEALRVMFGGVPSWARFTVNPEHRVRLRATDAQMSWLVRVGRLTGVGPQSGKHFDEPALDVADGDDGSPASAEVSGAAADLDCWLWNRPGLGEVQQEGSPATLAAFAQVLASGVQ